MLRRTISLIAAVLFLFIGLALGYLAYRRIGAPPQLLRGAVMVDGVITEKLVEQQRLSPLSITVPAYIVRYTFPTPQGQIRTGQQTITRQTYERLGDQGAPVRVAISPDDPSISAVNTRIAFPSVAGVRLAAAILCLTLAYFIVLFGGIVRKSKSAAG